MKVTGGLLLATASLAIFGGIAKAAEVASAAPQTVSPGRLYSALLTTAYPDSQLPSGFRSAQVSAWKGSTSAQRHHVVEVKVGASGPDRFDGLLYLVFATAAAARANLAHIALGSKTVTVAGKVPGFSAPSVWFLSALTKRGATTLTTNNMAVEIGDVIVSATTLSDIRRTGDPPATLALLRSGLRHLAKVTASLGA